MPKRAISDEEVISAVNAEAGTAREVLRFVHGHPELGHEEHESSAHVAATLARGGFQVERASRLKVQPNEIAGVKHRATVFF